MGRVEIGGVRDGRSFDSVLRQLAAEHGPATRAHRLLMPHWPWPAAACAEIKGHAALDPTAATRVYGYECEAAMGPSCADAMHAAMTALEVSLKQRSLTRAQLARLRRESGAALHPDAHGIPDKAAAEALMKRANMLIDAAMPRAVSEPRD